MAIAALASYYMTQIDSTQPFGAGLAVFMIWFTINGPKSLSGGALGQDIAREYQEHPV